MSGFIYQLFAANGLGAIVNAALGAPAEATVEGVEATVRRLAATPDGIYLAGHLRLAQFEALNLILDLHPPKKFIGDPAYSAYAWFHQRASAYASAQAQPTALPEITAMENIWTGENARQFCEDLTRAELFSLLDAKQLPQPFVRAFAGGGNDEGWFGVFILYFNWRLNADDTLRQPLMASLQPTLSALGWSEQAFLNRLGRRADEISTRLRQTDSAPAKVLSGEAMTREQVNAYVEERVEAELSLPPGLLRKLHLADGLSLDLLVLLAQTLTRQNLPRHRLPPALNEKAELYNKIQHEFDAFGAASLLLSAARLALDEARPHDAELYLHMADGAEEDARLHMLRGRIYMLQSEYLKAAWHFHKAATLSATGDERQLQHCLHAFAGAMSGHARLGGEAQSFEIAKESYRAAMRLDGDAADQRDRLKLLSEFGGDLLDFGTGDRGAEQVEEAAVILTQAAALSRFDEQPDQWTRLHQQLGKAYMIAGNRLKSAEHWSRAAQAFSTILQQRQREDFPNLWAAIQHDLGKVLFSHGEQAADPRLLNAAAQAFGNALQERPPDRQPLQWKASMVEWAKARQLAGALSKDVNLLNEAQSAFSQVRETGELENQFTLWFDTCYGLAQGHSQIAVLTGDQQIGRQAQTDFMALREAARAEARPWQIRKIDAALELCRQQ